MLYLVSGKDEFLREEFVDQLKTLMRKLPAGEHNLDELGPSDSVDTALRICDSTPFLCEKRMVIVRGLVGHSGRGRARTRAPRARGASSTSVAEPATKLLEYAKELPQSTHLVLVEETEDVLKPFADAISTAVRRDFRQLRPDALPGWITDRARKHRARISQRAARELGNLIGPNLRTLDAEIAKLATYVDAGATIDVQHIGQMVGAGAPDIFALQDALAERRPGASLAALHGLLARGSDPVELFVQIVGLVRRLLIVKELVTRRLPLQREAPSYGLSANQYALDKLHRQAERWTLPDLERSYALLCAVDMTIKSGEMDPELAVELAASRIAGI
ncbi:MAG: holA [Chloroflexi bacterium]|nr:holA [Chloroflexota bacterium]